MERGTRLALLAAGTLLTLFWIAASARFPEADLKDLYALTVVATIIVSALLLAEALSVASPVIEVLFGMIAGWLGAEITGSLEPLALMGGSAVMFLIGLEIDTDFIKRNLLESVAIGTASFIAPMAVSSIVLLGLGMETQESLLVAVGVSTTSVAIVYSIIRLLGVHKARLGQVALASAMVADMVSIVAFVALVVKTSTELLIYLLSIAIVPYILGRLLRGLPALGYEAEVRIIIALLLAATLASEAVGIHGVLASFVLGLALQEFANPPPVRDKIEAIITGFLAPIFFVVAGMNASLARPESIAGLALLLLLISYPLKIGVTHALFKKLIGGVPREIILSFGARLTVSTLIAYVGLERGLLKPSIAGALMLSAVIATLMSGLSARTRIPLHEA